MTSSVGRARPVLGTRRRNRCQRPHEQSSRAEKASPACPAQTALGLPLNSSLPSGHMCQLMAGWIPIRSPKLFQEAAGDGRRHVCGDHGDLKEVAFKSLPTVIRNPCLFESLADSTCRARKASSSLLRHNFARRSLVRFSSTGAFRRGAFGKGKGTPQRNARTATTKREATQLPEKPAFLLCR